MALNSKLSAASILLALNAALDVANGGFLDFYDGAQPATPETAITTQVKLARLPLNAVAFAAAAAGSKAANAITNGVGLAVSTATWYRMLKADGVTAVADGSVGLATSNIVMNDVAITVGGTVAVSSLIYSMAP